MLPCKIETRKGRQTTTPHRPKDQDVTTKGLETRRSTGLQKEKLQKNSNSKKCSLRESLIKK